jgi:HK97 family phage portal protein
MVNDAVALPYVTRDRAEGLPGIGRGVELISGVVAQLRPRQYRHLEDPMAVSEQMPTPPLLENPDPLWHGLPEWLVAAVSDMIWYGDAFAYRGPEVSDRRGYPTRLPLMDPTRFGWDNGKYTYTSAEKYEEFDPSDIAHFLVGARTDSHFGRGILDRYQHELKIMIATEDSQFVIMKNGKPTGVLSLGIDVNPDQAKEYKEGFLAAMRESGVAAIGNADFKPVQWSSADLSMIPTREFNLRLASDIVGVPPYLLGVPSESRVYANMETEWATFLRVTLGRYLRALESGLTRCLPRGSSAVIDTDQLLRSDAKTRFDIYASGITSGVLTVDEARQAENMKPLPKPKAPPAPPPTDPQATTDDPNAEEAN